MHPTTEHEDAIDWDRLDTTDREADRQQALSGEITELIQDFGKRAVVLAILESELSDDFQRLGIGGCLTAINRVLARIIDSKNPRLEADCMALASGLAVRLGANQSEVARKYGLTRSYISLRVRDIATDLQLPKTAHNKSERAQANYRLANRARR